MTPPEGTGEGTGTPEGTGQGTGQPVYHTDYSDDVKGWLDNRGMLTLSPEEALTKAINGHMNAEKSLGVPPERRIDLPADMAVEGAMDSVYNRLGRPEASEGYEFAGADTKDKPFDDFFRKAAHSAGMSKAHADAMYQGFKQFIGDVQGSTAADAAIQSKADEQDLMKEWGATFTRNTNIAKAAANKMGVTPDQFAKIQEGLGNNETMKLFQAIGAGFGEDPFVENDTGLGPDGPTTPEGASETIKELMKDEGWKALYLAGDVAARKKMDNLQRLKTGGG